MQHFSVYQELISQSSQLNRILFNPTKVKKNMQISPNKVQF